MKLNYGAFLYSVKRGNFIVVINSVNICKGSYAKRHVVIRIVTDFNVSDSASLGVSAKSCKGFGAFRRMPSGVVGHLIKADSGIVYAKRRAGVKTGIKTNRIRSNRALKSGVNGSHKVACGCLPYAVYKEMNLNVKH